MDVPVPKGCVPTTHGLGVESGEMDSMRYTAATCDPDEFMRNKFTLRPYLWGRKTELFVSESHHVFRCPDLVVRLLWSAVRHGWEEERPRSDRDKEDW